MQQLAGVRPDEGRSEDQPGLPVDDELGPSGRVVAQQGRAAHLREGDFRHLDVVPCLACLRLGHPDPRHLRVGVDDLWHRCPVGHGERLAPGGRGGDRVAEHTRAVLAPVGQGRLAAGVTHRVQPLRQPSLEHVVGGEPDRVEADIAQARTSPGRDEHLVRLDLAVVGDDRDRASVDTADTGVPCVRPAAAGGRRREAHGDSLRLKCLCDNSAGEGLLTGEEGLAPHEHRDLAAERGHPRRCLDRHDPATHDDEPPRDLGDRGRVTGPPRV